MDESQCIIVGNGTSLLDADNGPRIDRFGTVVRFNRFEFRNANGKFEAHTGQKTDVWFNGMEARHLGWRLQKPFRRIYLHSWRPEQEKDTIYQSFVQANPPSPFEKLPHALLDELTEFAQSQPYRTWSTGALGIWQMLKQFHLVWITGFDWWHRAEQHYFNPKAFRGEIHKPQIEKLMIEKLMAEGRLKFLL